MRRNSSKLSRNFLVPFCAALLALSIWLPSVDARAQTTVGGTGQLGQLITPEILDQIRRARTDGSVATPAPSVLDQARAGPGAVRAPLDFSVARPPETAGPPAAPPPALPPSSLEADYTFRAGESLTQYGYELFSGANQLLEGLESGAVDDDYRLGIGDELVVTFVGQAPGSYRTRVDREGRVILKQMPPISAAGRSFGEFRRELEAQTRAAFLGTDVYVSLGAVRAVTVMVMGEVENPGVYQLTGLSSLYDALVLAGGIKKTGSLRRIKVVRGDEIFWLDAYDLLFTGFVDRDVTVVDGDRIVVPSLGPTVAVAGRVMRPGIYELAEGESAVSLRRVLDYAGGTLRPTGNRYLHIAADETGRDHVSETPDLEAVQVSDGHILIVDLSENIQLGAVELVGHVRTPGRRSIAVAGSVGALIRDKWQLGENPYLLMGVIERTDERTLARRLHAFDLERVLAGQIDIPLRPDDKVIVLGRDDIRYLASADVQRVLAGGGLPSGPVAPKALAVPSAGLASGAPEASSVNLPSSVAPSASQGLTPSPVCAGLVSLATIASVTRATRFANAIRSAAGGHDTVLESMPCPRIYAEFRDLLPFLLEQVALLDGDVRRPGSFPILPETPLSSLVAIAGGLTREADLSNVELSRFKVDATSGEGQLERTILDFSQASLSSQKVEPGDIVVFNTVYIDREEGPVEIAGEVLRPGTYFIRRGERLSEVLTRAGGLTPQAYPYGAVFTRERVKQAERKGFERAALELESALATAVTTRTRASEANIDFEGLRGLVESLRSTEPVGRIVMEADPTALQVRPDLDTILEPGDALFIPKRPNFVTVIGEVLNPGTLQFRPGRKADEYIEMAGDYRLSADQSRVFVILPDGTAQPLDISFWNYTTTQIPPGSTIVVPRDPTPFDVFAFTTDVTQILGQLALTAASIAVISNP